MIYAIARGFANGGPSNNARKRHAREVLTAAHGRRNYESIKIVPPRLIFDDKDIDMSIIRNHDDPLLVKAFINNKEVHWLLVDIGSSMDIMFYDFFRNLRIL